MSQTISLPKDTKVIRFKGQFDNRHPILFQNYSEFVEAIKKIGVMYVYEISYQNSLNQFFIFEGKYHLYRQPGNWKSMSDFQDADKKGATTPELYIRLVGSGFDSMEEYNEAARAGFNTKKLRDTAKKAGFNNGNDYSIAKKFGYSNKKEWEEFKNSGFISREMFENAQEKEINNISTFLLHNLILDLPEALPVPLDKITTIFQLKINELRRDYQQKLARSGLPFPSITTAIILDLFSERVISELGHYEPSIKMYYRRGTGKAQNFETLKYAIVDGNNVAYDENNKPIIKRIIQIKEKIEKKKIRAIVCVSAALRHSIDEPKKLEKMLKKKEIIEMPAGRDDDYFVIALAQEKNGYIVSNDQFKDWIQANPEHADDIENRRVTFTYVDGEFVFDHKLGRLKSPKK